MAANFLKKDKMKQSLLSDATGVEVEDGSYVELRSSAHQQAAAAPAPAPAPAGAPVASPVAVSNEAPVPAPAAAPVAPSSVAPKRMEAPLGLLQADTQAPPATAAGASIASTAEPAMAAQPSVVPDSQQPLGEQIGSSVVKDGDQAQAYAEGGIGEARAVEEQEEEDEQISDDAARWGAAGVGCGVGYLIGGFFIGIAGGAAAAYAAGKEGKVGEAARASGRCMVAIKNKAVKYNRKHKVTEKVGNAASGAWTSTKEFNSKHRVTERSWTAMKNGYETAKEFNTRHQISNRIATGVKTGANKIESMLNSKKKPEAYVPPEPPLAALSPAAPQPLSPPVTAVVMDQPTAKANAPSAADLGRV